MLFEAMGAVAGLWRAFDRESLNELLESIPEFLSAVNSCLPQNRFLRLLVYGSGFVGMMQFTPYILRHTEFFDYYYRHIVYFHRYCPLLEEQKNELFTLMSEHVDELPKYEGKFMVLELQCGGGSNLVYYPQDTHLIAVDHDEKYEEDLKKNFDSENDENLLDNVSLERFICTCPEQLIGVPDETISAIVCVHSLCYPVNLDACFAEFKRVLMPGGRLYFIEHALERSSWFTFRNFQQLRFIFVFALVRCHLRRNTEFFMQRAGFSQVHVKHFDLDTSSLTTVPLKVIGPHIYGYAVK